ncbi:hypothetical protein OSB04_un001801 [Centaurea solstitialis]|uniref:Terpene synthase N-terminal domain-containing protein n=1 Tax=Centaurea solstitialis TaxID=347529 RepID=A0AA38SF14_9ASTR|nr:hypothetical protein OSB04_un001801 [Centaurea solstitialis]
MWKNCYNVENQENFAADCWSSGPLAPQKPTAPENLLQKPKKMLNTSRRRLNFYNKKVLMAQTSELVTDESSKEDEPQKGLGALEENEVDAKFCGYPRLSPTNSGKVHRQLKHAALRLATANSRSYIAPPLVANTDSDSICPTTSEVSSSSSEMNDIYFEIFENLDSHQVEFNNLKENNLYSKKWPLLNMNYPPTKNKVNHRLGTSVDKLPSFGMGDRFLSFTLDNSELEAYAQAIEKPKEDIRKLIINPAIALNMKLGLIYSVYPPWFNISFQGEIDSQLHKVFNEIAMQDYHELDLHTISIHFQVFRNHGYKLSCDVYNKFKDSGSSAWKEDITTDVRELEENVILDEALHSTKGKLNTLRKNSQRKSVTTSETCLKTSISRGIRMVEARLYFYDSLLKLAKANFKYLQLLQKEELRIVSKCHLLRRPITLVPMGHHGDVVEGHELQVVTPYARDRIPEMYLWILALFVEPYL